MSPIPCPSSAPLGISQRDVFTEGSPWQIARAHSRSGHLGVVSLVAVDQRLLRSLQQGDIGGTMRWALDNCPLSEITHEITSRYFHASRPSHLDSFASPETMPAPSEPERASLLLAGAFAEVFLAKLGHDGRIGIVWPDQTDLDDLAVLSGAMLARADCVLATRDAAPFVTQAIATIAADDFASWTNSTTDTFVRPSVIIVDSDSPTSIERSENLPVTPASQSFAYEKVPQ